MPASVAWTRRLFLDLLINSFNGSKAFSLVLLQRAEEIRTLCGQHLLLVRLCESQVEETR